MQHGVGIGCSRRVSSNGRVYNDGTVGQMRQIVVHKYTLPGEILTQHVLARAGHARQLILVIEVIQAIRVIDIILNRR